MNNVRRGVLSKAHIGARLFSAGDLLIIIGLVTLLYMGIRFSSPAQVDGPDINLSPAALPFYTLLSVLRMTASYFLSLGFSLIYGYVAAHNRTAERIMLPVLDVLQSVPLLSFLPIVLLMLTTLLPSGLGVEAAAVVLIFTSQAWNIAYSFYQSIKTVPHELQEAAAVYRMNRWYRLRYVEVPFAMLGLIWNSIVSWANGWFFLMAAETFRVQGHDFRLPGLGSYLQAAAETGDGRAIVFGFITLIVVVVLLDQLLWQPLLVWAEKFRVDLVENDNPTESWFFNLIRSAHFLTVLNRFVVTHLANSMDKRLGGAVRIALPSLRARRGYLRAAIGKFSLPVLGLAVFAYFAVQTLGMLLSIPLSDWGVLVAATLASTLRVFISTMLGLMVMVPIGVWLGMNPRLSARFQPIVQSAAAIPATAVFPVIVAWVVALPLGLELAAQFLIISTTAWYLLFNIIAGAAAVPKELRDVSQMYQIKGWLRWRIMILPAIWPYIITGLNIAGGGAWNASIVAEYTQYKNQTYSVLGLGSVISQSTATGNYPMLLAATLTMILVVVALNTFLWQRLHHAAQEKYRLD